jgi:hypothetical protein
LEGDPSQKTVRYRYACSKIIRELHSHPYQIQNLYMFMIFLNTRFHLPSSSGSLI